MNVLLRGIIAELLEVHRLGLVYHSLVCDLGHLSLPFLYLGFLLNRGNNNTFTRLLWIFNELIHLKHLKLKQHLVNGTHSIYVRIDHYNVYCCCPNFQLWLILWCCSILKTGIFIQLSNFNNKTSGRTIFNS